MSLRSALVASRSRSATSPVESQADDGRSAPCRALAALGPALRPTRETAVRTRRRRRRRPPRSRAAELFSGGRSLRIERKATCDEHGTISHHGQPFPAPQSPFADEAAERDRQHAPLMPERIGPRFDMRDLAIGQARDEAIEAVERQRLRRPIPWPCDRAAADCRRARGTLRFPVRRPSPFPRWPTSLPSAR